MQAKIGQFTRTQISQFVDGAPVNTVIREPPPCRVEPSTYVLAENVQGRAAYLYRIWHFHVLSDIFVFESILVRYPLC